MKYLILLAAASMAFVSCKKDVPQPDPIYSTYFYDNNFADAQEHAKSENRRIFVDFYATWCGICADFKTNVLSDTAVIGYIERNYVAVEMDVEGAGSEMYSRIGGNSTPILAVYENDGTLVTYNRGTMDLMEFLEWLEKNK